MRSRRVLLPFVAAALLAATLAGCGDTQVAGHDVSVARPATTEPWPWEEHPPETPQPTTPPVTQTPPTPDPVEPSMPAPTTTSPATTTTPPPPSDPGEPTDEATDQTTGRSALAAEVVGLTNAERRAEGCDQPLRVEERLAQAARSHSEDMAARDYFDHTSPEGDGPEERAEAAGYTSWSGENIAMGYPSAEAVVGGWMDSDGHRKNILDCDFRAIGVGVADSSRGIYWTQMFGYE